MTRPPSHAFGPPNGSIALVHDYMTQLGGAERVAGILAREFPAARLLTSVHRESKVPLEYIGGRSWETSFLQRYTRAPLKGMLPFLPRAVSSLDARRCELVISSSSAFAHHIRSDTDAIHVCFCHTPPRFLWEPDQYFRGSGAQRAALAPLLHALRKLDLQAAARVSAYIAVSRHVARRIETVYGRVATVVYPPVEVARFHPVKERSARFLVVSRLVRSKRVEQVVEAANRFQLPLDVIGAGPEFARLARLAGPSVRMLGWQPDDVVRQAMAECTAVVVAGEEDFGLVTAEAQASGRPPVAYAAGGALEIIDDGATGFLFQTQSSEAIGEAMLRAAIRALQVTDLRDSAARFDIPVFREGLSRALESFGWRATTPALDAQVG